MKASLAGAALSVALAACGGSATPPVPSSQAPATSAAAKPPSASSVPAAAASAPVSAKPAASTAPATTAKVKLTGAGSTADFPLFTKVFDAWDKETGNEVNYQSVGSGAGIEQLTKKTVDFGASDAIMTDEQEKNAGAAVLHLPVTIVAASIAYNLPSVKDVKLDGESIAGIYLGTIKSWDDPKIVALNPDLKLPKTPIAAVERSDGSGTTYIFTNYLSAVSADWKSKVGAGTSVKFPVGIGGKGNEGVAGQVSQTAGAVGYVEYAYAKQNNVSTALVKNQAGKFVPATVPGQTAAAAGAAANMPADGKALIVNAPGEGSYPISGFSWIITYKNLTDPAKGKALVDLFTYTATKGQQFAEDLSYAPLPPAVQDLDGKLLKSLTLAGKPQ